MNKEIEELLEWYRFPEKSIESNANIIEKAKKKQKYCFIRLYSTIYKGGFSVGKVLKQGTKIFSEKLENGVLYTHAAINYKLTDDFIGLNLDPANPNDVKIEQLKSPDGDNYSNARDYQKSEFTVIAIPLEDEEYENLKEILSKIPHKNDFKYDIKTLLMTALLLSKRRVMRFFKRSNEDISPEDNEEIALLIKNTKRGFICSTFVAYILSIVSDSFKKYLTEKKKSVYEFSPNSIYNIPGMIVLFKGRWNRYIAEMEKFVRLNPAFKPYSIKE